MLGWGKHKLESRLQGEVSITSDMQMTPPLFQGVVLGKTLEFPFDCKEIQPVHPEGAQSWVFTGRTDIEAETNT